MPDSIEQSGGSWLDKLVSTAGAAYQAKLASDERKSGTDQVAVANKLDLNPRVILIALAGVLGVVLILKFAFKR